MLGAPVGVHERVNRRWVRESGAGVKQRDPRFAGEWLADMLDDGALAAAEKPAPPGPDEAEPARRGR